MTERVVSNSAAFNIANPIPSSSLGWLRLTRVNNTFTTFYGTNGQNWTTSSVAFLTLNSNLFVGLAGTSHTNGDTSTASFTGFGVSGARPGDGVKPTVSAYFYNKTNLTLSCSSSDQVWALCYGAPCVVDEKDPSKSVCTCPIQVGPSMTLGGNCRQDACKSIWSAATPTADAFANDNFYKYMTQHNLQPPPNPPAKDCPATTTSQ